MTDPNISTDAPRRPSEAERPPTLAPSADRGRDRLWPAGLALVPFALLVYIGVEGGGFDPIVYGRVGVGIWWLVFLAAAAGAAGVAGLGRRGMLVAGLLGGLAVWTGLSMIWSESADRSAQELARASTYLAVLVGALLLRPRIGARPLLGSVAAAIGVLIGIALLARMQPLWFPKNETLDLVFASEARLNYPLNYWNGLAGLIAIGTPLLVFFAAEARLLAGRALAAAALPAAGLALYLTLSRGGALALGLALVALLVLTPRRWRIAAAIAVGGLGAGALILAANARSGFVDGLRAGEALTQGDEMLLLALLVCAAVGLTPLLARRLGLGRRLPGLSLPRRGRAVVAAATVVGLLATAAVVDLPARADDGWESFKDPGVERGSERLDSASGNGRYQWWGAALDANASAPLVGIGAGTFQFWWAREGNIASQVVDAHSLYLESLGELGIVGLLLVAGFVGGSLLLIIKRSRRAGQDRAALAAAAAATIAFAAAAATDWAWELPVLPIALMVVLGTALGARVGDLRSPPARSGRLGLAGLAAVGALVIVPPLFGADAIRASQERVRAEQLDAALTDAQRARELEPYSGPAALQEALVFELQGRLRPAARAAREAAAKEPTSWENWLVLSRIEVERGRAKAATEAFEKAFEMNPNSPLLQLDPDRGAGAG